MLLRKLASRLPKWTNNYVLNEQKKQTITLVTFIRPTVSFMNTTVIIVGKEQRAHL